MNAVGLAGYHFALKLVELAPAALAAGGAGAEAWRAASDALAQMRAENRDPRPDEWALIQQAPARPNPRKGTARP